MILVVQNVWPELAEYYELALAIVTNEGEITSYGVAVAWEFKIPCMVRTKIATKVFKIGDFIEVDANKGIVKKLSAV
ncbi:MAG: PEP-utilizing enzyme [Patescibacteria group bacterium]